jgi:glycine/D-amino acid oxidase-like deaminating enzyme
MLRQLVSDLRITAQWEDTPSIHAAHDPQHFDKLRAHAKAFQQLGVDARLLQADELSTRLGTSFYGLGVESKGGALVQPAMLAHGLASHLPKSVDVFEATKVHAIDRNTTGWSLSTDHGTLRATRVIVAVNALMPRLGLKRLHVFPLALTASLTRPLNQAEEDMIGHAQSWGVLSPRSLGATMRLTRDRRILIRNTAEYRPGGIKDAHLSRYRDIHLDGLRKRFPFLDAHAIDYTWSGSICISRNAKPVFEETAPGLFLCGGYNASGVSRGTIMGHLMADFVLGNPSDLLRDVQSLAPPSLLPPRPFLDLGVRSRIWAERRAAREER